MTLGKRILPLLTLLAVVAFSASALSADTIVLKNGDRVTGTIVKKDGDNLTIKSEQFGAVVVPWAQIQSIAAETPIHISLKDGKTATSAFSFDGSEITTASGEKIAPADVAAIRDDAEQATYVRLLNPGWGSLWNGTGTFGIAGTSGNSRTATYNAGLDAIRVTRNDKTSIYFTAITASALINDVDEDTAEAVRGGLSYNHNVSSKLFFSVFNEYEYDRFQDLDLRVVLGGGLGYHLVENDRSKLDLLSGASYNRSKFSNDQNDLTQNSAEFYWGDEYRFKMSSTTTLVQSFRMFHDVSDWGPYRMNLDVDLNTKVFKWLTWNVSVSDRYLSSPTPGHKRNDFMYTTGLGFSF